MTRSVPPLLLEQLALAELPPAEAAALTQRLGDRAPAELAALREDDASARAALPPAALAAEVDRRLAAARAARRRNLALWTAGPALACACALLLLLRPADPPVPETMSQATGVRIKGMQPHLRVYRRGAGEPEALADGALARRGDVLQLALVSTGERWAAALSLDGRGGVTVHWPESGARAGSLAAGESLLPSAYELDDAPDFERFVLVTRERPFDLATVRAAATALAAELPRARSAPLELPADFEQASLTLRKGPP